MPREAVLSSPIIAGHKTGETWTTPDLIEAAQPFGMPSLVGPDALPLGGQALAERSAFPSLYPQVNERADTDPVCLANQGLRGQNASMEEGIFGHPYEG